MTPLTYWLDQWRKNLRRLDVHAMAFLVIMTDESQRNKVQHEAMLSAELQRSTLLAIERYMYFAAGSSIPEDSC
jgi:hypothetical protein